MNPLYQQMAQQQPSNPMQLLQQLRSNPAQLLQQAGFNVPANILGNPQAIVQHLLQSGQLTQGRFAQAQQMAQQMMRR